MPNNNGRKPIRATMSKEEKVVCVWHAIENNGVVHYNEAKRDFGMGSRTASRLALIARSLIAKYPGVEVTYDQILDETE
jgi:hypothetical protein